MKVPGWAMALCGAILAACTPTDAVHRPDSAARAKCQEVQPLSTRFRERRDRVYDNGAAENPARCGYQAHAFATIRPPTETRNQTWAEALAAEEVSVFDPDGFALSLVEINDSGAFAEPQQLDDLIASLKAHQRANRQNYVVTLVHGWRHDASVRNADVEKFRTVLAYARSALNARCVETGTYCDAALTGVFLGWRGRSFAEPVKPWQDNYSPWVLGAAPTVWERKAKSETLAIQRDGAVNALLQTLDTTLTSDPGNPRADKLLVVGHSLGGNMLATYLRPRAVAQVNRHPTTGGRTMQPLLGDLVVLLNPASEAANWTAIQRAERAKAGLQDSADLIANADGNFDADLFARLTTWRRLYPINQRPIYISITSASNWSDDERRGRQVKFDTATQVLFPISRWLAGYSDTEQVRTIGHLDPEYTTRGVLRSPAVGTTHEFSVNQGTGIRARYSTGAEPRLSWCSDASGWLIAARQKQIDQNGNAIGWDYGLDPDAPDGLRAERNIAGLHNAVSVQWRHSLNVRGQANGLSVAGPFSPFWNVRALDTAIRDHAGWVNYPTWCAIHQLVLDDVTNQRAITPAVAETIAVQEMIERRDDEAVQAAPVVE